MGQTTKNWINFLRMDYFNMILGISYFTTHHFNNFVLFNFTRELTYHYSLIAFYCLDQFHINLNLFFTRFHIMLANHMVGFGEHFSRLDYLTSCTNFSYYSIVKQAFNYMVNFALG